MPCRIYKLDFQEKKFEPGPGFEPWAGMGTWIAQWLRAPGQ